MTRLFLVMQGNASVGPAKPPGAGDNYSAPAFALPDSMFDGANTSGPVDMSASNFGVDPNKDAAAANGDADEAKPLVSDVASLGVKGVVIADLVVPIRIEMPLPGGLPQPPPFINCSQVKTEKCQFLD
jgi:hypothetical protein